LKLGTVVNAVARSTNQDTISGKTDYRQPSDCESDEICGFFRLFGEITYLTLHPNGSHATEAIKNVSEAITDDVIKRTNATGGNQYDVQEQTDLRKTFASLRVALAKTSAPKKQELLKKLEKIGK